MKLESVLFLNTFLDFNVSNVNVCISFLYVQKCDVDLKQINSTYLPLSFDEIFSHLLSNGTMNVLFGCKASANPEG